MKGLIKPVNADNLAENWAIVDSERRTAKKKYLTSRIATFFSNMVLAFLTLFTANGLIHDHVPGSYSSFLESIPVLIPTWHKVSQHFLTSSQSWKLQLGLTALAVLGVSFLVCGLFTLLVLGIYHPRKAPLPQLTPKENADRLLAMATEARRHANRTAGQGNLFWALIFVIVQFVLIALYAVLGAYSIDELIVIATDPFMKLLEPYIKDGLTRSSVMSSIFMPAMMIECFIMYLAYELVETLHALSVRFMYRYKVPYSFVADVEYHQVFVDEETGGLTPEDIPAKRAEAAQQWLEAGLEMERICAYGKAKEFFTKAAHCGNPEAMEHYARHWLIANAKDPARYWLERCVSTGNASETANHNHRPCRWFALAPLGHFSG